jgi:hypothetical protein
MTSSRPNQIYLPVSFRVTFAINTDRGRYTVEECEPGFTRVPRELIVEHRQFNDAINAELILRGPNTEKKEGGRKIPFFTGLIPTRTPNVYLGNVLTFTKQGERVRNGVVVRFSTDAATMVVRYFPAYYPYPDQRAAFVQMVLDRGLLN